MVLLPLLSVILVTIGHWFAKISSLKYVNFKHRYLFFGKLRKCPSKHKIIYALHKIFLLLLIALLYDVKVPAKTYHNTESKTRVHHELFMRECFASTETTRTSCLKEQYSLCMCYQNLNTQNIAGTCNIYYSYQVTLIYIRVQSNIRV